jgi:hypothetical protein
MAGIEDEGKSIAKALQVEYTGPQYYGSEFKYHLLTDPKTGSTFAVNSLEDAKEQLGKERARFNISQERSAEQTKVLERFPYPAPEKMEIGGDIGKMEITIPTPRGMKLKEGLVIRTSKKNDHSVEHLGYHSISLSDDELALLESKGPTDIELIEESQNRLKKVKIIPDDQLSSLQLAHLNLARAIAIEIGHVPPAGIHAAIIPPASDRVKTAGLYGTKTGAFYLSIDMLSKARDTIDTYVHELGHHKQFTETGEAEDLTPIHEAAMKVIADKLVNGLNSGVYDKLLKDIQY